MYTPSKSLLIKIAISAVIVSVVLAVLRKNRKPRASLIPAKEGFEGDGLPEYADVEYSS
jgi:hypothetical protein